MILLGAASVCMFEEFCTVLQLRPHAPTHAHMHITHARVATWTGLRTQTHAMHVWHTPGWHTHARTDVRTRVRTRTRTHVQSTYACRGKPRSRRRVSARVRSRTRLACDVAQAPTAAAAQRPLAAGRAGWRGSCRTTVDVRLVRCLSASCRRQRLVRATGTAQLLFSSSFLLNYYLYREVHSD